MPAHCCGVFPSIMFGAQIVRAAAVTVSGFTIWPRLSAALDAAEHSKLRAVAALWADQRVEEGGVVDTEIADAIVCDPAALLSSARRQGQSAYCWYA